MNASHEALVLTRPPDEFYYDGVLALRAAARMRAGEPLQPPEVYAATDPQWERDVMRANQRLQFEIDYEKRPSFLQ